MIVSNNLKGICGKHNLKNGITFHNHFDSQYGGVFKRLDTFTHLCNPSCPLDSILVSFFYDHFIKQMIISFIILIL